MFDKQEESKPNARGIKHFSSVQNKPIYLLDIEELKNKVMMNIEVPAYWHLDTKSKLSAEEVEYQEKMAKNVVYLSLKKDKAERLVVTVF